MRIIEAILLIKGKMEKNRKIYIDVLRRMTPEQRLKKAFEISEFTKQLSICGFRKRYSNLPDAEFKNFFLEHIKKCHNRNY